MRRASLVDSVVSSVAADIITGQFEVRAVLPSEPRLSASFNVSRTVVREAMIRLAQIGLIRIRQGAGTTVTPRSDWNELDPDLLRIRATSGLIGDLVPDLLEIRRIIEVEVVGYAAVRRTDEELSSMSKLLELMYQNTHDAVAYTKADIAFHEELITACGNALLRHMMKPVNQVRYIGSALTTSIDPSIVMSSMVGHQEIFDAVTASNASAARDAMMRHIAQFERNIADALTVSGSKLPETVSQDLVGDGTVQSNVR